MYFTPITICLNICSVATYTIVIYSQYIYNLIKLCKLFKTQVFSLWKNIRNVEW